MKRRISLTRIVFWFLIFSFAILINNPSFASTSFEGFSTFDNSPRMTVKTNSQKYDDVVISFRDFSSLDESKIVFYTAKDGKIGKKITDKIFIKKIDKHYGTNNKSILVDVIYTISNKYLNKKTNEFYVTVSDKSNSPCKLEAFFRIKSNGNRYVADTAPRVQNWKYNKGNCSFVVQDWVGINYVKLYDMYGSNPSNIVLEKKNLPKGNNNVQLPLNNFTVKNGKYCIKIITQDNNKTNKQLATRVVKFQVSNAKISLNKTKISMEVGKTEKLVISTTDNNVKWSSSKTSVATVNNGVVKGVGKGTAVITATISNGEVAKCTVEVKAKSTSSSSSSSKFDLKHAKKVGCKPHSKSTKNLPWHGSTVGSHAGMIASYVNAINILNNSNHSLREVYNLIIKSHPNQKYKNVPVYKNKDINNHYKIKVSYASPSVKHIRKALDEGKIVAALSNTTKWRNAKGNLFGKTGQHTGLIFHFDGKYYHMKTTVVKDALYTEQQLKDWLKGAKSELIIYSKKQ